MTRFTFFRLNLISIFYTEVSVRVFLYYFILFLPPLHIPPHYNALKVATCCN